MKTLRDFGFGKQTSMESVLSDEVSILLETRLDKNSQKGEDLCMHQFFALSVLNILWSMVAGITFSHDDQRIKYLLEVLDDLSRNNPIHPDTLELLPIFWRLHTFSPKLARRRNSYKKFHNFFKVSTVSPMSFGEFFYINLQMTRYYFSQEVLEERRALGDYKKDCANFFDVFLAEIDSKNQKKDAPQEANYYTGLCSVICLDWNPNY